MTLERTDQLLRFVFEADEYLREFIEDSVSHGTPQIAGSMFASFVMRASLFAPEWARYWDSLMTLSEAADQDVRDFIASLPIEARDGGS